MSSSNPEKKLFQNFNLSPMNENVELRQSSEDSEIQPTQPNWGHVAHTVSGNSAAPPRSYRRCTETRNDGRKWPRIDSVNKQHDYSQPWTSTGCVTQITASVKRILGKSKMKEIEKSTNRAKSKQKSKEEPVTPIGSSLEVLQKFLQGTQEENSPKAPPKL